MRGWILAALFVSGCATSSLGDGPDAGDIDARDEVADAGPDAAPDACQPTWVNLLGNADFEAGNTVWDEVFNGSDPIIREFATDMPFPAAGGTHAALIFGYNNADETLSQVVSVPADASALRLRGFRCWVTTETAAEDFDLVSIEIGDADGNPLETLQDASNQDAGATCAWEGFELAAAESHAGESLTLAIGGMSDAASPTTFAFDTLALEAMACP